MTGPTDDESTGDPASPSPVGMREIDPAALAPAARYRLLVGSVVPRPIALVSTVDAAGRPNLAPFSFFNAVGSDPMLVVFCPGNRPDGGEKDSLRNAAPPSEGGTGAFVIHVVTEPLAAPAAITAEDLPFGESEFDLAGLATTPSRHVAPPRVAAAPAGFECLTREVIRTGRGRPGGGNLVIGEVVHAFIREDALDERLRIDPDVLDAVGRMGGSAWCRTRDRFDLARGRAVGGPAGASPRNGQPAASPRNGPPAASPPPDRDD